MIWPVSTPYEYSIPISTHDDVNKDGSDHRIVAIDGSKAGYFTAVVTRRSVLLFRPKPFCPVTVYHRSESCMESHGGNRSVYIRPDGQALGVTTEKNSILVFHINSTAGEVAILETESQIIPGPGEAIGVRDIHIHLRIVLNIDSGIDHVLALSEHLMVITQNPAAIQLIRWPQSHRSSNAHPHNNGVDSTVADKTILLSSLDWMNSGEQLITHLAQSKAMMLLSFVTSSGAVYTSGLESNFQGHVLHKPEGKYYSSDGPAIRSAINARFSLVAVGCQKGSIYLYNIRDFQGSVHLVRRIVTPATSLGSIQVMKWSSDGYSLFAGYENGWALFSVYGLLNASSFLSSQDQKLKESWLDGIVEASWAFSGDLVFVVSNDRLKLWGIPILRWSACGNYTLENLQRPVLYTETKLMLYRGHEQSDLTTIDRDALLWLHVHIPASYISENWPIKYVSSSGDGRYLAVSGVRGLTHYSIHSGRWKLFPEDFMDREFTVRGGLLWYGHILIAAVDTEHQTHEIRMYSRELDLDPNLVLLTQEFPSPIYKIFLLKNDHILGVYTSDNVLSFHRISYDPKLQTVSLNLEYEIGLSGIVHSPARVRSISCFPDRKKKNDPVSSLSRARIILLVDGMLVLLIPVSDGSVAGDDDREVSYQKRILHDHIEYYNLTTDQEKEGDYEAEAEESPHVLWAFDGKDMLVWLHDITKASPQDEAHILEPPTVVPVEAYPLSVMIEKGIVMGVESNAVLPRDAIFTYFKHSTSTQLFVPFILEAYLRRDQEDRAQSVTKEYRELKYFGHILEMLLYRILDSEATKTEKDTNNSKLLTQATSLLSKFPQMLDVVVLGCTRKTELSYWKSLFDVLGSPQDLFERCIQLNQLKTAGGYLLVLHNLEKSGNTEQNTVKLFKMAYDEGDLGLCKELARFLTAIDPTGSTLKRTLDANNLSTLYSN